MIAQAQQVKSPRRVELKLSIGEIVTVSELAWRDAAKLQSTATAVARMVLGRDEPTKNRFRLVMAETACFSLVPWLVMKATGRDKKWLQALQPQDLFDIALEALKLHSIYFPQAVASGEAGWKAGFMRLFPGSRPNA